MSSYKHRHIHLRVVGVPPQYECRCQDVVWSFLGLQSHPWKLGLQMCVLGNIVLTSLGIKQRTKSKERSSKILRLQEIHSTRQQGTVLVFLIIWLNKFAWFFLGQLSANHRLSRPSGAFLLFQLLTSQSQELFIDLLPFGKKDLKCVCLNFK